MQPYLKPVHGIQTALP